MLAAGLIGLAAASRGSSAFAAGRGHKSGGARLADAESALGAGLPGHARSSGRSLMVTATVLLVLWLAPVALLAAGGGGTFAEIALFFSKMAVVTFGGAYAVLAYVAQAAVEDYGWLRRGEMLDGLGLAETTPGPLIMVTQFVGSLGAFRNPEGLPPLLAATLAGLLTTWVTFVPCFLWIFIGAPYVERLRQNKALAGALSAITAAVVGVVLNLALWFALHYLFRAVGEVRLGPLSFDLPDWGSIDWAASFLSALALAAVFRLKMGMLAVIGLSAVGGIALQFLL